jgi:hypothetical protein
MRDILFITTGALEDLVICQDYAQKNITNA